jgi:phage terminase large subunit-like protein
MISLSHCVVRRSAIRVWKTSSSNSIAACGREQAMRWFPMHLWGANTRDPKDGKLWQKLEAELIGRKCFAGIDLASTVDIAAVIYGFPPLKPGDRWTFICRFFCNEAKDRRAGLARYAISPMGCRGRVDRDAGQRDRLRFH